MWNCWLQAETLIFWHFLSMYRKIASVLSMFRSAPVEFHWRSCCLCGKHLKHLNSATTHWSTPDGVRTCWLQHLRGQWMTFCWQQLLRRPNIMPCLTWHPSFHLQPGRSEMLNEALEWRKHFESSAQGVGGATDDMKWWTPNKQFTHLNTHQQTLNTHQQNLEHPPTN